MAENLPNPEINLDIKVHDVHKSTNFVQRTSPRQIIIKLSKIKDKKILKAIRKKKSSHTWELPKSYKQMSQQKP